LPYVIITQITALPSENSQLTFELNDSKILINALLTTSCYKRFCSTSKMEITKCRGGLINIKRYKLNMDGIQCNVVIDDFSFIGSSNLTPVGDFVHYSVHPNISHLLVNLTSSAIKAEDSSSSLTEINYADCQISQSQQEILQLSTTKVKPPIESPKNDSISLAQPNAAHTPVSIVSSDTLSPTTKAAQDIIAAMDAFDEFSDISIDSVEFLLEECVRAELTEEINSTNVDLEPARVELTEEIKSTQVDPEPACPRQKYIKVT
jgi:hypothetical protein